MGLGQEHARLQSCARQLLPRGVEPSMGWGEAAARQGRWLVRGVRLRSHGGQTVHLQPAAERSARSAQPPLPSSCSGDQTGSCSPVHLRGRPPLLLRQQTTTLLGDWGYAPVMTGRGGWVNRSQRLLLALWGHLLGSLQGVEANCGFVLRSDGHRDRIPLAQQCQGLTMALQALQRDLASAVPPPLLADRRRCAICSWRRHCDAAVAGSGDLADVSGVGGRRRERLQRLGILTVQDLAATDGLQLAAQLEAAGEQNPGWSQALVQQAQALVEGVPLRRPEIIQSNGDLPELTLAPGVLLYDIESDPDRREHFLHGFLALPRQGQAFVPIAAARYHPILALPEHGEARCWERLQTLLGRFPNWPVLHYGETERIELLRLARRQGATAREREALSRRLVDLHQRLRHRWVLPLKGYGLKVVATWLGFRWHSPAAEGVRAVLWWRQWRQRGNIHDLRRILHYNADDCRATWVVAQWLTAASGHPPRVDGDGGNVAAGGTSRVTATSPQRMAG